MHVQIDNLWGLLVLAADIWGIINVAQSAATTGKKVLWILLILLLPVVGLIFWYFLGPRAPKT